MFLRVILSLLLVFQEEVAAEASPDLKTTDKQALLDFAIPHELGWKLADGPICTTWAGVTCNSDQSRVVELRLSGFGLCGSVPENTTIARLDALEALHLENNFLSGPIPPGLDLLPRLKSLTLSNNGFTGLVPPSLLRRFPRSSFGGNPSLTTSGPPRPEVTMLLRLSSLSSSKASNTDSESKKPHRRRKIRQNNFPLAMIVAVILAAFLLLGGRDRTHGLIS